MRRPETLFPVAVWASALEAYTAVARVTVHLYGPDQQRVCGPFYPTPLYELFASRAYDPGVAECVRRCFTELGSPPAVAVVERHGLGIVGAPLVLEGEVVGAVVAGYALTEFPNSLAIERLARASDLPFQTVWNTARQEGPVSPRRLLLCGELLQVLGESLLKETDRTRRHEETSARLVEAMGAKDRLLAVLSHELRTPLTPILTWAQSLKREPDARQVRQAADVIEWNVRLEARLVEDLLDLGRITGGQVAYEFRTHDLRAILRTAQEALTAPAAGKAIRLESTEGSDPVPVEADADRLRQVFSNLLGNAVKFTPERGAVEVRLTREAEWAVVRIRDTGIGIAPDFLPHVFDMFRQQEEGTRRDYGGFGIGLAVAKRLTERHGGSIAAASEGIGRGAEFTVRLPLAVSRSAAAGDAGVGDADGGLPRLDDVTVLVVEDSEHTRESTRVLLEDLGARVRVAVDGREALDAVTASAPDVILCDLRMPRMDGFEFIRCLRRDRRRGSLPAIAVSGFATPADHERSRDAGFDDHIGKPFDAAVLVAALHTALHRRARSRSAA